MEVVESTDFWSIVGVIVLAVVTIRGGSWAVRRFGCVGVVGLDSRCAGELLFSLGDGDENNIKSFC